MCVFAHYAADNRLGAGVIHQLHFLCPHAQVIFVTQSVLSAEDQATLGRYCAVVIRIARDVLGRDFTSYQAGVRYLLSDHRLQQTQWLWLVNDSFYGPFCTMDCWTREIQGAEQSRAAAWGLTNSFQRTYHIQSYFVAMNSVVFKSERFRHFMAKPWSRGRVIERGELALFREVIHPRSTVALRSAYSHQRDNPCFQDWEGTLQRGLIVKKGLLRRSPQVRRRVAAAVERVEMDPEQRARLLECVRR